MRSLCTRAREQPLLTATKESPHSAKKTPIYLKYLIKINLNLFKINIFKNYDEIPHHTGQNGHHLNSINNKC